MVVITEKKIHCYFVLSCPIDNKYIYLKSSWLLKVYYLGVIIYNEVSSCYIMIEAFGYDKKNDMSLK